MPSEISITAEVGLWPAEPDGSECQICGEAVYLRAWEIAIFWNIFEKPVAQSGYFLCGSCGDACDLPKRTEFTK